MDKESKFKTKGVSSSNPFPRELIPLNKIEWEVLNDSQIIQINSFEYLNYFKSSESNLFLGVYVYDSNNDILFSRKLSEVKTWPLIFEINKEGFTEFSGGAFFRVYIFEKDSKKIISSTTDIKLVKKADLNNLLELRAGKLGKRIASLEIKSSGPILTYNKEFITEKGKLYSKIILSLIESDPTFMCSYFPTVLDRIFSKAFLLKNNNSWAKNWMDFANDLVPGIFSEIVASKNKTIEDLEENDEFQDELVRLSDAWISLHKLDSKLYDSLKVIS